METYQKHAWATFHISDKDKKKIITQKIKPFQDNREVDIRYLNICM